MQCLGPNRKLILTAIVLKFSQTNHSENRKINILIKNTLMTLFVWHGSFGIVSLHVPLHWSFRIVAIHNTLAIVTCILYQENHIYCMRDIYLMLKIRNSKTWKQSFSITHVMNDLWCDFLAPMSFCIDKRPGLSFKGPRFEPKSIRFYTPATKLGGILESPCQSVNAWLGIILSSIDAFLLHLSSRKFTHIRPMSQWYAWVTENCNWCKIAFPFHLQSWNFTHRLSMSPGYVLIILWWTNGRGWTGCRGGWGCICPVRAAPLLFSIVLFSLILFNSC